MSSPITIADILNVLKNTVIWITTHENNCKYCQNGGGEISNGITVNISGGEVLAVGNSYGAGIGGGEYTDYYKTGCGGDVTITGGTVIAIAGNDCKARESDGGSAIGCGQGISGKEEKSKKLDIADNMMVTGGDSETNIERVFTSTERIPACRWRNYVRIEACTHTAKNGDAADVATTYTIDDEFYHTKHCRYCNVTIKEMHSGEDCVCGRKNQYEFTLYVPDTEKNSYKEGSSTTVGAGKNFYLPECSNVPAGYIFAGWEMNPDPEGPNGHNRPSPFSYFYPDNGARYQALSARTHEPSWRELGTRG